MFIALCDWVLWLLYSIIVELSNWYSDSEIELLLP